MQTVQIGSKGVLVLPKSLRTIAGLDDGSFVNASVIMGKIVLEPARVVSYPVRQYSNEDIDSFLEEDKKLDPKIISALDKKFGIKLDTKWHQ